MTENVGKADVCPFVTCWNHTVLLNKYCSQWRCPFPFVLLFPVGLVQMTNELIASHFRE